MRLNEAEWASQQLSMCVYENNKHSQQLSMCVHKNNKHLDNLLWGSPEHKQVYGSLRCVDTTNKQHCLSQGRQHTWLFLLVLNLLHTQSFIFISYTTTMTIMNSENTFIKRWSVEIFTWANFSLWFFHMKQ